MKKKAVFISAFVINCLLFNFVCSAEDYDGIISIESKEIVRGSENPISIAVNVENNNGLAGIRARFECSGNIPLKQLSISESEMLIDSTSGEIVGEYTLNTNTFLWSSKTTENIVNTGKIADIIIDSENLYPGVYDIKFIINDATKYISGQNYVDASVEWVNGILTVNGNDEDIENARLICDMDNNEAVDSYDALNILQNVVGLNQLDDTGKIIGDSNFDGNITSEDALNILTYTSGLTNGFSDGENSAIYAGIYFNEDNSVKTRSYYKDKECHSIKINYSETVN